MQLDGRVRSQSPPAGLPPRVLPAAGTRWARLLLAGYLAVVALLTIPPVIEPYLLLLAKRAVRRFSGAPPWEPVPWVEPSLNVLLFIPLAALLCWSLPRLSRLQVWLLCGAGSVGVELAQLLFLPDRTASVRDVVTNSTGAAIGVGLHWLVTRGRRQSVRQQ